MKYSILVLTCQVFFLGSKVFSNFVPENHPNWRLLDHKKCGLTINDRIIGGHDASLGEFPWLAQLGTKGESEVGSFETFYCGGALITPIYAVSAAHCIPQQSPKALKYIGDTRVWAREPLVLGRRPKKKNTLLPNTIRAGDYDLSKDVDCVEDFCAPPVQYRDIVKIIVHPEYNKPKTHNDIILAVAGVPFDFNGFVNSICLLPSSFINNQFVGEVAEVAGWGVWDIKVKAQSKILQVVQLPVMANKKCAPKFAKFLTLTEEQMCVGGEVGKDSCSGDSGGPLMKALATGQGPPKIHMLGVVSLGFTKCGATTNPGIYTRMTTFEEWVLDNMEASP